MSYLDTRITRDEFIKTRGAISTQANATTALNLFDHFCNGEYQKSGEQVVLDMEQIINSDGNYDRLYRLCNGFVQWLLEDHLEILVKKYRHSEPIRKHNPSSVRRIISSMRQYLEEFGRIDFSERKFRRMVKLPKEIHQDPEPFTKAEIRQFVDNAMPKRKALYMLLKDSGLRIGEAVQLKKSDIDMESNPVTVMVQASYTKTKKSRISFVTRETKPFLKRVMANTEDDDLIFGVNEDYRQSVNNEEVLFARTRTALGYNKKYECNNRYKKNLHSFRAFCATQLTEEYSEEFAHGFIGHKGYLTQYIRNKDKLAEKYLRAENSLMIFESVEVVEYTDKVEKLEKAVLELQKLYALKEKTESEVRELESIKQQLTH
jgi:integrase